MLDKNTKIYVAGHRGLVGSAIWNNLWQRGYHNLIGRSHAELDLTNQAAVRKFFDEERPEAVVLAAAFVGGIMANSLYRADFIMKNMQIQCNVIEEAYKHGVQRRRTNMACNACSSSARHVSIRRTHRNR